MARFPICVVRHGQTDWNAAGRLQGQKDIPINGRGRAQAEAVGRFLKKQRPDVLGFDFVASPLGRTRETMEIMRRAMDLPTSGYRMDSRLMELTFGNWAGFTWPEVRVHDPAGAAAREAGKWAFVPPSGESYEMLSARVRTWLGELRQPTLAVTHGGVARVLLGLLTGMPNFDLPNQDIIQGRALMFEDGKAQWL
ncbi:histidine phosphatase family protein [Terrihabitans sp. B22-R8]|uniref:histidine phosphatase family protein n=1 Tax=Terrihabitans sp. B22-R8 TaxID=3425128 RepID=UPI00403CCC58